MSRMKEKIRLSLSSQSNLLSCTLSTYFSFRVKILPENTLYVVVYHIYALIVYLLVNLDILDEEIMV